MPESVDRIAYWYPLDEIPYFAHIMRIEHWYALDELDALDEIPYLAHIMRIDHGYALHEVYQVPGVTPWFYNCHKAGLTLRKSTRRAPRRLPDRGGLL